MGWKSGMMRLSRPNVEYTAEALVDQMPTSSKRYDASGAASGLGDSLRRLGAPHDC
jgi:hypothetical protein